MIHLEVSGFRDRDGSVRLMITGGENEVIRKVGIIRRETIAVRYENIGHSRDNQSSHYRLTQQEFADRLNVEGASVLQVKRAERVYDIFPDRDRRAEGGEENREKGVAGTDAVEDLENAVPLNVHWYPLRHRAASRSVSSRR